MGAGPDSIVVNPTGCLEVTSTPFPLSSWQVPWIHSLFENGVAVASGIDAGLKALGKKKDTKIIVIAGDGATMDIGFGAISGAFERGHALESSSFSDFRYGNYRFFSFWFFSLV